MPEQRNPSDVLMIEAQAALITKMNAEMHQLHSTIAGLNARMNDRNRYIEFYQEMQKAIIDNPAVMSAWQEFCLILKLADPDEKKYDKI